MVSRFAVRNVYQRLKEITQIIFRKIVQENAWINMLKFICKLIINQLKLCTRMNQIKNFDNHIYKVLKLVTQIYCQYSSQHSLIQFIYFQQIQYKQRMMDSKLAVLLTEVAKWEQKIEIAREILGQNMNFSPAWLLTLLQKQGCETEKTISIKELANLLQYIKASFQTQEIVLIFDYFDVKRQEKIQNKVFVQGLLPFQKNSLRKAVLKRLAEDLSMTSSLKYALKRFFQQILNYQKQVMRFQGAFNHSKAKDIQSFQTLNPRELQSFLKLYGKCLSQNQISLIMHSIELGRIKAIKNNLIIQIIKQTLQLPFAELSNTVKKVEAKFNSNKQNQLRKYKESQSLLNPHKKEPSDSKFQTKRPKDERKQLTGTPIERIKEYPQGIHFPKSSLIKKTSNLSEISILDSINDEATDMVNPHQNFTEQF